jgi:hypothetical protein
VMASAFRGVLRGPGSSFGCGVPLEVCKKSRHSISVLRVIGLSQVLSNF